MSSDVFGVKKRNAEMQVVFQGNNVSAEAGTISNDYPTSEKKRIPARLEETLHKNGPAKQFRTGRIGSSLS